MTEDHASLIDPTVLAAIEVSLRVMEKACADEGASIPSRERDVSLRDPTHLRYPGECVE